MVVFRAVKVGWGPSYSEVNLVRRLWEGPNLSVTLDWQDLLLGMQESDFFNNIYYYVVSGSCGWCDVQSILLIKGWNSDDMMIVELQRQLEDHFSLKEMATLAKNRKESLHLRVTKLNRVYSIDSASRYKLHMGTIRSGTPYEFLCKCIVYYSGCSH